MEAPRDKPSGRAPEIFVHVVESVHGPLAQIAARYQLFTVPLGMVVVMIETAASFIVNV